MKISQSQSQSQSQRVKSVTVSHSQSQSQSQSVTISRSQSQSVSHRVSVTKSVTATESVRVSHRELIRWSITVVESVTHNQSHSQRVCHHRTTPLHPSTPLPVPTPRTCVCTAGVVLDLPAVGWCVSEWRLCTADVLRVAALRTCGRVDPAPNPPHSDATQSGIYRPRRNLSLKCTSLCCVLRSWGGARVEVTGAQGMRRAPLTLKNGQSEVKWTSGAKLVGF